MQVGQRIVEIAILALAEAVPRHVDMAAEMLFMRIERGDLPAFLRRQQLLDDRAAIAAEVGCERRPVIAATRCSAELGGGCDRDDVALDVHEKEPFRRNVRWAGDSRRHMPQPPVSCAGLRETALLTGRRLAFN